MRKLVPYGVVVGIAATPLLLLALGSMPTPAKACGCFSPPLPAAAESAYAVAQQGEQIIFEVGESTVTAHVLIHTAVQDGTGLEQAINEFATIGQNSTDYENEVVPAEILRSRVHSTIPTELCARIVLISQSKCDSIAFRKPVLDKSD